MKKYLFASAALFMYCCSFAKVTLPAIINSNMVLQQRTVVPLWGWADAGKKLTVTTSWNKKTYTSTVAANGAWKAMIATPAAGGPYSIKITDGQETVLDNVLIGEVWFCSGQSNMEMPVKGFNKQPVTNSQEIIAASANPNIRLFTVKRNASASLVDTVSGNWQEAAPSSVEGFSAVGYLYAKLLQQKLNVPVGIIASSWGGTPIEAWMSQESLEGFKKGKQTQDTASKEPFKNRDAVLYNGMINPVAGYGIKGFLWYQGEANRKNPGQYAYLMKTMVELWRTKWNNKNLPFYYVQIAPFGRNDSANAGARVREAQLKALSLIPHSGMAVNTDIGSKATVHPPDKSIVAERLYRLALAQTYDFKDVASRGPVYKTMRIVNDTIQVRFENAGKGLTDHGKGLQQFEIAGEDKIFHPAEAKITASGISAYSRDVKKPVALRYAFKDWVVGDLFNAEGLPASSFRTDNW